MTLEGPSLQSLTSRLAETPSAFLAEPRIGKRGEIATAAVVGDLCRILGIEPDAQQLTAFAGGKYQARNFLMLVQVASWLLADSWFQRKQLTLPAILRILESECRELAQRHQATAFINDDDRREELARLALARLDHRPAGETEIQAQDRLTSISSSERERVIRAAREAEARNRELREALARKAAQESADKYTRE